MVPALPVWGIAKVLVLIALAVYFVFALVVVRQVGIMTKTLEVGFELPIKMIALIHLLFAIGVFVLGLVIL